MSKPKYYLSALLTLYILWKCSVRCWQTNQFLTQFSILSLQASFWPPFSHSSSFFLLYQVPYQLLLLLHHSQSIPNIYIYIYVHTACWNWNIVVMAFWAVIEEWINDFKIPLILSIGFEYVFSSTILDHFCSGWLLIDTTLHAIVCVLRLLKQKWNFRLF